MLIEIVDRCIASSENIFFEAYVESEGTDKPVHHLYSLMIYTVWAVIRVLFWSLGRLGDC